MTDEQPHHGTSSHRDPKLRLVPAIAHGTVIDHLPPDKTLAVAGLVAAADDEVLIGVNFKSAHLGRKGVVKITGRELSATDLSRLSVIAPHASMAIIRDYQVVKKAPIPIPNSIIGVARCPNPNCVTNHEPCTTHFLVEAKDPVRVRCRYCERAFLAEELTLLKGGQD